MKKMLQLLLVIIVLMLAFISPHQHLSSAASDSVHQYTTTDTAFILTSNFLINEKSKHTNFPEMPNFIFILLLSLVLQSKLKPHFDSFIPLMKCLYLLYPIKYQSRYLVPDPTHI
jgi:hypothetical protein